jgi:CHAT domain-containing protein/Flp pilus assembly protein TadD
VAALLFTATVNSQINNEPTDWEKLARELHAQGEQLSASGDQAAAIPLLKRAVALRERALGNEHIDTAHSIFVLARAHQMMGDDAIAEPLYLRALAVREKVLGEYHVDTGKTLNNLANVYGNLNQYDRAESLLKRALSIWEKTLGAEHYYTATTLNNLGQLYMLTGDYVEAEPAFLRSLAIYEKSPGIESDDAANVIASLAWLYSLTGAYAQAEPLHLQALSIREKVLGPKDANTARSIGNLGNMYYLMGEFSKALPLQLRSIEIYEEALGVGNIETATAYNDAASTYAATRDFKKAEELYRRALEIKIKLLGPKHSSVARSLNNLGDLYRATASYEKAVPMYQQALAIWEKTVSSAHPDTIASLNGLGSVFWVKHNTEKAVQFFKRAQLVQEKNNSRMLLTGSESRKKSYIQILTEDTSRNVSFSTSTSGYEAAELGLRSVLQYKGRVLDVMTNSYARLRSNTKDADDIRLLDEIAQLANKYSTLIYQESNSLSPTETQKHIESLGIQQKTLESKLATRNFTFRQLARIPTVDEIRRHIPADAALIEWFRYQLIDPAHNTSPNQSSVSRYVAYIVKRDIRPVVVDVGDAESVDALVQAFRASLDGQSNYESSSRALQRLLIQPLSSHLQNTKHLLVSPDGALNLIPIAALIDEHGEYLASQFNITYLTSGRDLLHTDSKSSSQTPPVIVANPNFGEISYTTESIAARNSQRSADIDRGGLIFRPLGNTSAEAQELKVILGVDAANVLVRDAAREESLKQLHGPSILHIASHGFFLSDQDLTSAFRKSKTSHEIANVVTENPLLRAGIALSGANARRSGPIDDGILTALETSQLDLHGTELVVLSACDSAVGEVHNGEGVYGLRRALVLAGAETQVTSLWKVSDEATLYLMIGYYRRLVAGEGRSSALQHTQLEMLKRPEFSHPYYWASFVPIGNWAPLSKRR